MPKDTKNPADCLNNRQGILKTKRDCSHLILGKFIVSQSPIKGKDTMEPREIKGLEIAAKTKRPARVRATFGLYRRRAVCKRNTLSLWTQTSRVALVGITNSPMIGASIFLLSNTPSSASSRRMVRP
jgi:hypothetical protein